MIVFFYLSQQPNRTLPNEELVSTVPQSNKKKPTIKTKQKT